MAQSTFYRYLIDQRELKDPKAFIPRFREAARQVGDADQDPDIARYEPAPSTVEAWYYGTRRPNRAGRRVLVAWLGYSFEHLWSPAEGVLAELQNGLPITDVGAGSDEFLEEIRKNTKMAARRAREFAMGMERGQLGDETLGFLQDEVREIAEKYQRVPLSSIFADLTDAQDRVFRLIEGGRTKPSQLRQLHIMATLLSWFMAKAGHDMGDSTSAMMQARTAGVCAQQAERPDLMALTDGLKSLITYWSGAAEDAMHYARKGAAEHPELRGTVSVWLPSLEGRAAALLGDHESAQSANQRAHQLRELVEPDELDELGGLLTFPQQKQLYYEVESQVLLDHGDAEVLSRAEQSADAFSDDTTTYWAFGDQAGAQCNLGLARLYAGDIDGAADALRPVLDLVPSQRNRGIVVSAQRVATAITRRPVRTAAVARELREEILAYAPQRLALPQ